MTTWNLEGTTCHLLVCGGSSCRKRKGEDIIDAIDGEIEKQGAEAAVHTTMTRCNGRCSDAPVVISYPDGVWYGDMSPKLGKALVRQLLQGGRLEDQIVYTFGTEGMQAAGTPGTKGKKKKKGRPSS